MTPVFMDTVGLLATWDVRDPWHSAASAAYAKLIANRWVPMTSSFVLLECGNAAARRSFRSVPARLREHLIATAGLLQPSDTDVESAWSSFKSGRIGDAGIVDHVSFCECVSTQLNTHLQTMRTLK